MENEGILKINRLDFGNALSQVSVTKAKSYRAQIIEEVVEHVNHERLAKKLKPLTPRFIAVKINTSMKHDMDLDYFVKRCREKGYSFVLFGYTKVK